jgi:hypothetical protein
MQFRTVIPIETSKSSIDYNATIVSFGSCFAASMGSKLDYYKFRNAVNPFGIIFNPVSIEHLILRIVSRRYFTESDLFFHQELWHCFEVHSEFSSPNAVELLDRLNSLLDSTYTTITQATHILLTYGTSWVYREINTHQLVANCHKVPQKQFDKEILSVLTLETSIQNTIELLHNINPNCTILITVSPVRHSKDGFVENQRSKAHLITAIHSLLEKGNNQVHYFPSYEIVMDELRDYRFYAEDLLHPNSVAIDYIWHRFKETQIETDCYSTMETVEGIQRGLAHRPFNPSTASHQKFVESLNQKIISLQEQFPHIQFY